MPKDLRLARLETVDRGDGIGSVFGTMPESLGETELNQTVYETYSAFPEELVAHVLRVGKDDLQFVYRPSQFSATASWGTWLSPLHASTDRSVAHHELRGRTYAMVPTPGNPPKVRYRLMGFRDYLAHAKARREGALKEVVGPC